MADDLVAKIMADYPSFAFLLNDPEIGPLLLEAVDPNQGFDQATFQAKLLQTNWWKSHSDAARSWQVTLNTDPASAQQQREIRFAETNQAVARAGLQLSDAAIGALSERSLQYGVATSSAEFQKWLAESWATPGIASSSAESLKQLAEGQYMTTMDDSQLAWWATQIGTGFQTQQGFTAMLAQQAKGRFPTLSKLIDEGVTPGAYFAPYKSTIAQQLEVSPDSIDLMNDPKWSGVLSTRQSDGSLSPMTLSEAISLARDQPEWRSTSGARDQASQLGQQLLTTLGATK